MFGCPRNRVNFSRYIRIAGEESGTASTPVSGESRNSSVSIGNSCRENDSNRSLFVTGNSAGKKFGEARDWAGIFSGNSGYRARVLCRPAHEGADAPHATRLLRPPHQSATPPSQYPRDAVHAAVQMASANNVLARRSKKTPAKSHTEETDAI